MAGRTGNLTANISIDKEGRKAWQCLGFAFLIFVDSMENKMWQGIVTAVLLLVDTGEVNRITKYPAASYGA